METMLTAIRRKLFEEKLLERFRSRGTNKINWVDTMLRCRVWHTCTDIPKKVVVSEPLSEQIGSGKSLGIGIGPILYREKVSESISDKFCTGKISETVSKNVGTGKSLAAGIGIFLYWNWFLSTKFRNFEDFLWVPVPCRYRYQEFVHLV